MNDLLRNILKAGLYGEHTHINPKTLIESLTPKESKIRVDGYAHSIWDLLHHMVIWQDFTIKGLDGEEPDWKEIQDTEWLAADYQYKDVDFHNLVEDFVEGLEKLETHIESTDSEKSIPALGDSTAAHSILVVIQHNSYHLGQILVLKNLLFAEDSH